jgi:hypothetical protein
MFSSVAPGSTPQVLYVFNPGTIFTSKLRRILAESPRSIASRTALPSFTPKLIAGIGGGATDAIACAFPGNPSTTKTRAAPASVARCTMPLVRAV